MSSAERVGALTARWAALGAAGAPAGAAGGRLAAARAARPSRWCVCAVALLRVMWGRAGSTRGSCRMARTWALRRERGPSAGETGVVSGASESAGAKGSESPAPAAPCVRGPQSSPFQLAASAAARSASAASCSRLSSSRWEARRRSNSARRLKRASVLSSRAPSCPRGCVVACRPPSLMARLAASAASAISERARLASPRAAVSNAGGPAGRRAASTAPVACPPAGSAQAAAPLVRTAVAMLRVLVDTPWRAATFCRFERSRLASS